MSRFTLIVFVKNQEAGKVKTRLAKSVGPQRALQIYQKLLAYTRQVVLEVNVNREIWYSSEIKLDDLWTESEFSKYLQTGRNLGERMKNAFRNAFEVNNQERVLLIGSDCAELTSPVLERAFSALAVNDLVFGPALDGGYYLVGMSKSIPEIFDNISWSTPSVLDETLKKLSGDNYLLLEPLNDVDEKEDWERVREKLKDL